MRSEARAFPVLCLSLFTALGATVACDSGTPAGGATSVAGSGEGAATGGAEGQQEAAGSAEPTERPAPGSAGLVVVAIPDDAAFSGAGLLLPRPAQLEDWRYAEDPAYYTADTLAELLGDGAEPWVGVGVEQVAHASLRARRPPEPAGGDATLAIDVFRMSTPQAARERWGAEHGAGACERRDDLRAEHCLTASGLDAISGPYYLRFTLDGGDAALVDAMVETARLVLERLTHSLRSPRPVVAEPRRIVPGPGPGRRPIGPIAIPPGAVAPVRVPEGSGR